ncbi:MAG: hypothetical protein HYR48_07360 [Gemmatimonadetes bacterium]|nr:hypothetical protein [Gemmatimonadota bacterium]
MRAGTAGTGAPAHAAGVALLIRSVRLYGCAALALVLPLAAQNPPPPAPAATPPATAQDSARPPRPDSLLPDSLSPDSFRAALPTLGPPPGPLARGGRVVFDEDSLRFLGALTLGELLARIPGVFLVRAGWYGVPEVIAYAGQGAASVEIFWDGYALDPLGEDRSAIDVGRFSLGLARRVEVEVLPTVLRVHLFSDVQAVRRPRTETSFATGDAQTNTYRIRYLNRWKSGAGLGVGVSWFGTNGPNTAPADVANLSIWVKGTWSPSPLVGVEYQLLRQSITRDSLSPSGGGPSLAGVEVRRTDGFVRAYAATRPDGMGLRLDAVLGSSSYRDSAGSLERTIAQGAGVVSFRAPLWSAEMATRLRDTRTPLDVQLRGSWIPFGSLTLSAYGLRRTHLDGDTAAGHPDGGGRRSLEAGSTAELRVTRLFSLVGAIRWRDAVASPENLGDTAQRVLDWSFGAGLHLRRGDLEVGFARHGTFEAPAFEVFRRQIPFGTSLLVRTVTATVSVRPTSYLTVSGWYRHPLDPIQSAFEPPHHSRVALTFRSRFLPTFRRGIFDVVGQVGLDGWSDGVAGTDSTGAEIELKGATTLDWLLEIRLVGAVLFWTMRNSQLERYSLVPGFEMPRGLQRFGVRWEFTN